MSKTVSTCILETNLVPNQPQENIFFHTLYRTMADFPNEFVRTARSTSPIQVVAILSTQGPDSLAAMLNIELNQLLSKIVSSAQGQPVLDFESFSNQVVNSLNVHVCNYIVSHGGNPLKTSMSMAVIEGDTLRMIHIGNTKAILVRGGKIMALTEDQTVAHRYVQMGAITAQDEANHPGRFSLTQYLGKMPQDGAVMPDKKVHLKLKDNDSICLMGIGISKLMPAYNRNSILIKPMSTEAKAHELVNSAANIGVKYGLSFAAIDIESTLLLPGDAIIPSANNFVATNNTNSYEEPYNDGSDAFGGYNETEPSDTQVFNSNVKHSSSSGEKSKSKHPVIKGILLTLLLFILCAGLTFGGLFAYASYKGLIKPFDKSSDETLVETVMYITADGTPLYSAPSEGTVIASLAVGERVIFVEQEGTFTKVVAPNNVTGYVLTVNLSASDPLEAPLIPTVDPTESFIMDDENSPVAEPSTSSAVTQAVSNTVSTATESTAIPVNDNEDEAVEQAPIDNAQNPELQEAPEAEAPVPNNDASSEETTL
ncbi:MAG: hypothetical protein MJ094_03870 [Saccharofermentans sp.]|nr:hypothetical protein [Saccharofermentans sp.]